MTSLIEVAVEGEVMKEGGPLGPSGMSPIGRGKKVFISTGRGGVGVELLVGGFGGRRGRGSEGADVWRA